jgi:hypothetical protein
VTINQSAILSGLDAPNCGELFNASWVLARGFKVSPQLDVVRLTSVLNQLRDRHEALRTRFVRTDGGGYQALILAKAAPAQIEIEKFDDPQQAELRAREIAGTAIDPYGDTLIEVRLLRVGTSEDIVVARGHHLLLDGYSLGLLVEEIMQLFLGMTLDAVEIDTKEFIRSIDLSLDDGALRIREAILNRLYACPAPPVPAI